MASSHDNKDLLLDAYLDRQLTQEERLEFEESVKTQPELAEQIELQSEIDASLQRMFTPPSKPRLKLPSLASLQAEDDFQTDPVETSTLEGSTTVERSQVNDLRQARGANGVSRRWLVVALTTAAAVAWLYVGAELFTSSEREQIAFHQRPLTEVYQECVDQGFMPYWVCDDETTFANTFEHRQGVKLKLGEMPPSQQMVGLSYLAGLSRDSTSMLARVDGKPVIVFVDRIENDWKPATGDFPDVGLSVTRTERKGLVLYEVSPTSGSEMLKSVSVTNSLR